MNPAETCWDTYLSLGMAVDQTDLGCSLQLDMYSDPTVLAADLLARLFKLSAQKHGALRCLRQRVVHPTSHVRKRVARVLIVKSLLYNS